MLIDDVTIKIKAGDGGRGAVAFNKNLMSLGPAGGDGGDGGNIYFEGVSDLSALTQFRYKKELKTKNGEDGRGQFRDGSDGTDLILKVPIGTIIHNQEKTTAEEIIKTGQKILAAKGGHGGKGNFQFRAPHNTSPVRFQFGLPGENFTIRLELKLIADIGIIGLPNAGKSSLINELTKAQSKVANYPFTTLEPNLGTYFELILADIPGLIEGASAGKGLGIKFLRHIERTKILFHLISSESENPSADYAIIRKELERYSQALADKPEYLFLTKSDLVPTEELTKKLAEIKKINQNVIAISINDEADMTGVKSILNKVKSEK